MDKVGSLAKFQKNLKVDTTTQGYLSCSIRTKDEYKIILLLLFDMYAYKAAVELDRIPTMVHGEYRRRFDFVFTKTGLLFPNFSPKVCGPPWPSNVST